MCVCVCVCVCVRVCVCVCVYVHARARGQAHARAHTRVHRFAYLSARVPLSPPKTPTCKHRCTNAHDLPFSCRSPQMNEETPRSGTTEATDCSNLTSSMPISRCQSEERPPRHPVDGRAAKTPSPFINARRSGSKLPPLSPNVAATPQPHSDAQVLEVTQTLLHYIPKPNFEPSAEERTISPASSVEKVKQRALRGAQVSDVHRAAAGDCDSFYATSLFSCSRVCYRQVM